MIHYVEPSRETLHDHFSRSIRPALTIQSGDTVRLRTLDSAWGIEKRTEPGASRKRFTGLKPERQAPGFGHALVGPIAVEEARKGMTLEVRINELVPGKWGWTSAGGFPSYWNQKMGVADQPEATLDFDLDATTMTAQSTFGTFPYRLKLRPFMGIMGMLPDEPGPHPTVVPRFCGGNIDCKELVAGSTLYLPVSVDGALFSVGDGHAVQGDGEVAGPALECPMELIDLTLSVRDDIHIGYPRAHTPTGWVTMGMHEDLDEAVWIALDGMLTLMQEFHGMSRTEAYAFATLVVDMRVTQVVNTVRGAHAFLNHKMLRR